MTTVRCADHRVWIDGRLAGTAEPYEWPFHEARRAALRPNALVTAAAAVAAGADVDGADQLTRLLYGLLHKIRERLAASAPTSASIDAEGNGTVTVDGHVLRIRARRLHGVSTRRELEPGFPLHSDEGGGAAYHEVTVAAKVDGVPVETLNLPTFKFINRYLFGVWDFTALADEYQRAHEAWSQWRDTLEAALRLLPPRRPGYTVGYQGPTWVIAGPVEISLHYAGGHLTTQLAELSWDLGSDVGGRLAAALRGEAVQISPDLASAPASGGGIRWQTGGSGDLYLSRAEADRLGHAVEEWAVAVAVAARPQPEP